ncbi:MAG: hypothetical protein AAF067_08355 [Pseudomonadota bacterium]
MTGGSKIVEIRDDQEGDPHDHVEFENSDDKSATEEDSKAEDFSVENKDDDAPSEESEWSHYADDVPAESAGNGYLAPTLLGVAIAAWTGFFGWANQDIFVTLPTPKAGIELVADWSLPIILFSLAYLLFMRNSTREAKRFTDVSSSLRLESEQLQTRLKSVNNELSMAREFLAGETRELATLGSQSTEKLTTAADSIKTVLNDGLRKMTKLDEVGAAAYQNLEQLREHLPVVINTAKDVTNQIGNSGRSAQTEMARMITTLERVGEVGTNAKQSLDQLNEKSAEALQGLATTAEEVQTNFARQLEDTQAGSGKIAADLKNSAEEVIAALHNAQEQLASETSRSSQAIRADMTAIEESLQAVSSAADEEDTLLKELVSELDRNVLDISQKVAQLDNEGGEKTAKLAFAMNALRQNNDNLQQSLNKGYGVADGMIERIENLLIALDSGAREMDETLPAAFDRMNEKSDKSIFLFDRMTQEATKITQQTDALSAKIERADSAIEAQSAKLQTLREAGNESMEDVLAKIDTMSASLREIRDENESLAESAGEKLITALLRVKETANQASEFSRNALENSIMGSTDQFEKVSEEALNRIIDEKIASIAPKLESAVSSAVATTQSTAGHLTEQLTAIEDMTTNLEQRILFAKEKAEQSSEENFTRRVALLTESLNSTAIDLTKLMSNEVTDTEWAAYLKGDRGIFSRRAVRLLDSGEVREILAEYEGNSEFREHVNRYIHDFEAMLRGVLATRDGSAISVTLLSSDIGKLYVALAQAIERLRN